MSKIIRFKYKIGDEVITKFGTSGIIEELRYSNNELQYSVWHDKSDYIVYSENQIILRTETNLGAKIGFNIK